MPLWWYLFRLRLGGREARAAALRRLCDRPDARAVPALLAVFARRSGADRQVAVELLGAIGDRRAVAPLVAGLRSPPDPDFPVGRVAWALGRLGDLAAIDALAGAFRDPPTSYPQSFRKAAAEALDRLGYRPADQAEALDLAIALGRAEDIAPYGLAVLDRLNDLTGVNACEVMARLDWGPATDAQRAAGVRHVRRALGEPAPPNPVNAHPLHWYWDSLPLRLLNTIDYPRTAYELLCRGGSSWEINLKLYYLPALSTSLLVAALEDPDYHTARLAAEVLGKHHRPAALPALAACHAYNDGKVRESAINALVSLARVGGVIAALAAAAEHIARYTEAVTRGKTYLDPLVREKAIEVLGKVPGSVAADALRRATQDQDAQVREAAAKTLASVEAANRDTAAMLPAAADGPIETRHEDGYRGLAVLVEVAGGPAVEAGDFVRSVATLDDARGVNALLALVQAEDLKYLHALGLDALALLERFLRRDVAAVPEAVLRRAAALPESRKYNPTVSTGKGRWESDRGSTYVLDFTGVTVLARAELARRAIGSGSKKPC